MGKYRDVLNTFDESSIPDLDVVVLGALELFEETQPPKIDFSHFSKPLVIGSGNAFLTAQIVFSDRVAVFADESSYSATLEKETGLDGAVVFSASGSKHAIAMVADLQAKGLETHLVTNTPNSPASAGMFEGCVHVFPKNREPYTYNTSTYFGSILGKTGESASQIEQFIQNEVLPKLPQNLGDYTAFTIIIPSKFEHARAMLRTKFDELFGPQVNGRVFTDEEVKHAKTVISSDTELFISFDVDNEHYGLPRNRLHIDLPEDADYGAMLAIGYFVVGKIQAAHPPYFKQSVVEHVKTASDIFGLKLGAIVE